MRLSVECAFPYLGKRRVASRKTAVWAGDVTEKRSLPQRRNRYVTKRLVCKKDIIVLSYMTIVTSALTLLCKDERRAAMLIDFNAIRETIVPGMNDGEGVVGARMQVNEDRKSTRLNSSH